MKISTKVFIFSLLMQFFYSSAWTQEKEKLKAFKSDINNATITRVENAEKYMEELSSKFLDSIKELEEQRKKNAELENELKSLKESIKTINNEQTASIEKRLTELEVKTAKHDFDKLQLEHDKLLSNFNTLSKDYAQAKVMLEQIKLLLMTDYTSRFNSKGPSDNKLKGIVEEINKIQLPKEKPTPPPSPTSTATPTATPIATSTPSTATNSPKDTSSTATQPEKEENFIEKYPLPARQSFCRQPENLRKFQKECLPYL